MTSNITPRIQMCAERERQLFRKHWTISSEHLVFGRPFVERFALSHGTFVCLSVLSCLSVCNVGGLWPNSYIDYRMPLDMQVGLVPGDVVLDGNPAPPPERGTAAPHFSVHVYCGQTVANLSNCWALVVFSFFFTLFVFMMPCGRLSRLFVSFWVHVNIVYRIVSSYESYRITEERSVFYAPAWTVSNHFTIAVYSGNVVCVKPWFHVKIKLF